MKKLIFLLILVVVLASLVSAMDASHPPGALTPDAAMPGYDAHEAVITPDTVPADMLFERPAGFLAVPDCMINGLAGQPWHYPLIKSLCVGQRVLIPPSMAGFHLRL